MKTQKRGDFTNIMINRIVTDNGGFCKALPTDDEYFSVRCNIL